MNTSPPSPPPSPLAEQPHGRLRLTSRLTGLALGAAALALVIAGVVLNTSMYRLSRAALVADQVSLAQVIADNVVAAVKFGDERVARETLATLSASPEVLEAVLADADGQPVARYARSPGTALPAAADADPQPDQAVQRLEGRRLWVWQPVRLDGRTIGQLRLTVSLDLLFRQAAWFGGITLLTALGALAITYGLAVGVRRDVQRVEGMMDELAYLDAVTGLPNRHAATGYLQAAVEDWRNSGRGFCLLLLDLDDFKDINDSLGHPAGDAVLKTLADRLVARLPTAARAFRFGGDEFIVIARSSEQLGESVLSAIAEPVAVEGELLHVRCSAGLASFPQDGVDPHTLVRAADTAMYQAKSSGKNAVEVYRPQLQAAAQQRLQTEAELRRALARDELRLHYQPIVQLGTGRVVGAEALVRWQHPERGLIGPAEFIAVAESTGLITALGAWVLAEAARQVARWQAAGLPPLFVAVNVSPRQLRHGELLRQLDRALAESPAAAGHLEIEITEHTLVENGQDTALTLLALRERGLRMAIDDFGTGLSSLAYLKRLPVDKLKIDRGFVHELPGNQSDLAIVQAVLSMARALGLRVVAEGVETAEQQRLLVQAGCEYGQGWHFGRPVPAEAFAQALRAAPPASEALAEAQGEL
jgi:diguanylate cyclase (GGDEF)-like protein